MRKRKPKQESGKASDRAVPSTGVDDAEPLERKVYLGEREGLNKMELEVSGRYDQWLLTLAGGALALSITFLDKIAPHPEPSTLRWLIVAWGFLLITLILGLVSLLTSQSAIRRQRDILDHMQEPQTAPSGPMKNRKATATRWLNVSSMVFFALGIVFLCVFSVLNPPKEDAAMAASSDKARKPVRKRATEGVVPPSRPKPRPRPADKRPKKK